MPQPRRKIMRRRPLSAGSTESQLLAEEMLRPADPLSGRLVVRLNEAWDILQISPAKGFELIKVGRLKVTRLDRITLVHVSSIRELLT